MIRTGSPETIGAVQRKVSCTTGDTLPVSSGQLAQTTSTSHDSKLNVCTEVCNAKSFANCGFEQFALSCVQKCAEVIPVVFDGWCLGNVLVVGVADVIERRDSDVVGFDGESTCCAFDFCLPRFELAVQPSMDQIS